jgi:hypothetical protein
MSNCSRKFFPVLQIIAKNCYHASKFSSKLKRIWYFASVQSGMLDDGDGGRKIGWRVYGQGAVTLYRGGKHTIYRAGKSFEEDFLR